MSKDKTIKSDMTADERNVFDVSVAYECFAKDKHFVDDKIIIEQFFQRDEIAIHNTDVKYGKMLYRIAYNILHDREDCEECKNDTYLGVWNAIPPTRPTVFPAFITQIMRNIATKKFKAKTRNKRIPTELTVSTDELVNSLHDDMTPESEYSANELGRLINEYVRSLTERQQYIFIGRYYLAETIEYLSSVLNVGVATVHRDLEKIKKGLKAYLEMNGVYV